MKRPFFLKVLINALLFLAYYNSGAISLNDSTNRIKRNKFIALDYQAGRVLPSNDFVKGKPSIRVKFQALPNTAAGAVYVVRLLRPEK